MRYNGMKIAYKASLFVYIYLMHSHERPIFKHVSQITTNLKCHFFASQRFYKDLHGGSASEFTDGKTAIRR